jgi:hypothetical protein
LTRIDINSNADKDELADAYSTLHKAIQKHHPQPSPANNQQLNQHFQKSLKPRKISFYSSLCVLCVWSGSIKKKIFVKPETFDKSDRSDWVYPEKSYLWLK